MIGYVYDSQNLAVLGICIFVIMGAFSVCVLSLAYFTTYDMPMQYIGKCEAIEETKELLLKYENTTDIALGLESVKLKASLAQLISEKNEKLASIRGWLANPIMPFKDNIRYNLGTYIIDL